MVSALSTTLICVIFFRLGCFVALNPIKIIVFSWIIVIFSALGLLCFHQEKNPVKLWVPQKSEFVRDTDWLLKTFQNGFRPEEIIIEADDVLTPEVLLEVSFNINQHLHIVMWNVQTYIYVLIEKYKLQHIISCCYSL